MNTATKWVPETSELKWVLLSCWKMRHTIILILLPLLLLPLAAGAYTTKPGKAAYCLILMGVFWVAEVLPMPVTSLIPVALFPLMGILPAEKVAIMYLKDTSILFIGALVMAIAVECSNLHKRLALKVLLFMGSQKQWLLLGFMLVTWFLSMWISNTATTAMLLPIAVNVLDELRQHQQLQFHATSPDVDMDGNPPIPGTHKALAKRDRREDLVRDNDNIIAEQDNGGNEINSELTGSVQNGNVTQEKHAGVIPETETNQPPSRFEKGLILSIAYSANIGGTVTLTGTHSNMIMVGQVKEIFDISYSFLDWIIVSFPGALISICFAWLWMLLLFLGPKVLCSCFKKSTGRSKKNAEKVTAVIRGQYEQLGSITFREKIVLANFFFLVLMWMFREPHFIPGWASFFTDENGYISDGTAAFIVAMSLFCCPATRPVFCWSRAMCASRQQKVEPAKPVLDWETMTKKLPWGVVFLLGAGYALAEASKESGLSVIIANSLKGFGSLPDVLILFLVCALITGLTNVMSKTATITILIPILVDLSASICMNPYYLILPATINCSFAFMLPAATPPNALVFASGKLKIMDMVIAGTGLQVLGVLNAIFIANTYGKAYLDLDTYPEWAAAVLNTTECIKNVNKTSLFF